jgi:hypothetical protein
MLASTMAARPSGSLVSFTSQVFSTRDCAT